MRFLSLAIVPLFIIALTALMTLSLVKHGSSRQNVENYVKSVYRDK